MILCYVKNVFKRFIGPLLATVDVYLSIILAGKYEEQVDVSAEDLKPSFIFPRH